MLELVELPELLGAVAALLLEDGFVLVELPGAALALRMLPLEFGVVPGAVDDMLPGFVAELPGLVAEGLLPGEVGDCVDGADE
ncbi:MAG TPA: hypothetical protein VIY54_11250 [Steroidobacteraceae bacterium]